MKAKIGAAIAAVAAAASAAGAAAWARRKREGQGEVDLEVREAKAAPKAAPAEPVAETASSAEAVSTEAPPKAAPAEPSAVDVGAAETGGAETGGADDLTVIKGLGPLSAERLGEHGVTTLAEIAAWNDADIERIAPQINLAADRIRRDDWVGQARAATEG